MLLVGSETCGNKNDKLMCFSAEVTSRNYFNDLIVVPDGCLSPSETILVWLVLKIL